MKELKRIQKLILYVTCKILRREKLKNDLGVLQISGLQARPLLITLLAANRQGLSKQRQRSKQWRLAVAQLALEEDLDAEEDVDKVDELHEEHEEHKERKEH